MYHLNKFYRFKTLKTRYNNISLSVQYINHLLKEFVFKSYSTPYDQLGLGVYKPKSFTQKWLDAFWEANKQSQSHVARLIKWQKIYLGA